jgi:hypothetical protein
MGKPSFSGDPADRAAWQKYYDAKIADPNTKVDRKMPGQPRVPDDKGNYFTRKGSACCNCGLYRNYGPRDENGVPSSTPASDKPIIKNKNQKNRSLW